MAPQERGDFMAIATDRHAAPPTPMGARVIVEEQTAGRVSTAADGSAGAFDEKLRGRTSEGCQEPVEAALAGDKLKRPRALVRNEFVMTFGDAKDLVDRLDPGGRERFFVDDRSKNGAERLAEAENPKQRGIDGLRFSVGEGTQSGGAIFGDQPRIHEKRDKLVPRKIVCRGGKIGKIESEAAGDELGSLSDHGVHRTKVSKDNP
jgi:hypothetical protein